ncbi:thioredoxin domain-containing protein [Streptomyces sp. ODS28]|uniref:DsbA family protein n=1 Tax=Streptomyces sp. ODS28 TaxID=3136688 RepID=UPI0031ED3B40
MSSTKPTKSSAKPSTKSSAKPSADSSPKSRKGLIIGVTVAVVALLAGWLSQYMVNGGGSGSGGKDTSATGNENATVEGGDEAPGDPALMKLARRDANDPMARGKKDAPVVMIEYADFGCSFCGKFARDTEPALEKKYIDKGLLRIEWRNFPVFGEGSNRAALAGWAAGEQGRFWQFYKAVYADEGNEKNSFTDGHLHDIAKQAGIEDLDRFDRDRKSKGAQRLLAKDQNEAYSLGAAATPAFLINGRPIAGAQPDQVFTDTIDAALAEAKKKDGGSDKGGSGKGGE